MLTCVFATHNGAKTLPVTLEAFTQLEEPEGGWKLIAVDNASTDKTAEILASYKDRLPLTILNQPERGKNGALNLAIPYFEGDLVVFTDDDVVPAEDWLCELTAAAERYPDISVFTGQVRHYWMKTPPEWLRALAAEGRSFGGTPVGKPEEKCGVGFVRGANMMVRYNVFLSYQFPTNVGPDGTTRYVAGSETQFVLQLVNDDYDIMFVPSACVEHIVRPHQVGVRSVIRRYFRIGRGGVASGMRRIPDDAPQLFGYPRYFFRLIPMEFVRIVGHVLTLNTVKAMSRSIELSMTMGAAYQWKHDRVKNGK